MNMLKKHFFCWNIGGIQKRKSGQAHKCKMFWLIFIILIYSALSLKTFNLSFEIKR